MSSPSAKSLNVLVIGSGGREHALVRACKSSPLVASVAAAPGNGGMETECPCHALDVANVPATVALAKSLGVNFVIVGPEVPLALGAADALEDAGFIVYGPRKAGAMLEASKVFTKDFLVRYNIPTAKGAKFTKAADALEYLRNEKYPTVIKASGLAAGKGVVIPQNFAEAATAIREMMDEKIFGASGDEVLVEEFMEGEEASIMVMVCGEKYVILPPSQDHKRAYDGDTGPNTGGMGAYTPTGVVTDEIDRRVRTEIVEPTLRGLKADGIDYRGTLYVGIMVTTEGPKVVEFNVRFGDPECQILLPMLKSDPVALMHACATGTLEPANVEWKGGATIIVVLAAGGYPGEIRKGDVITLPASVPDYAAIIHAGTKKNAAGEIVASGGRVLGVVAHGATLKEASARAYAVVDTVKFTGMQFRRDIGARQLKRDAEQQK
jgi:phosphoribosylamine--glycine ligase